MLPHMWLSALACQWRGALCALLIAFATPAAADDLADFNAAVEAAMSHHRVALGYLRTGNVDLATVELEYFRDAWRKVTARPRPAAFDTALYTETMLDISTRVVTITLVLNLGRPDVAIESLSAIRTSLSRLRRAAGVTVLADCVLDADIAMDALFALDGQTDWDSVSAGAESYRGTLQRCDGNASPDIRNQAEFRRLIDGALASLAQIPKAAETHDGDLLHRLLIELRAFDNLLAFRYG